MKGSQRTYLPAAGRDWALPLYDPLLKLLGGDAAIRALIDQAALGPADHVLDIGCGTGTLVTLIKRVHPGAEVVGLDPDPKALARARRKAAREAVSVRFDQGFSDELPYSDACFERVFSSFMFHHLHAEEGETSLREARRVLAPGGSFHLLDFVRTKAAKHGGWSRLFHSSDHLKENLDSRILALLEQAGFVNTNKTRDGTLLFGLFATAYYRAYAPESARPAAV